MSLALLDHEKNLLATLQILIHEKGFFFASQSSREKSQMNPQSCVDIVNAYPKNKFLAFFNAREVKYRVSKSMKLGK